MEKSKEELLDGMTSLSPAEQFPDEIFYHIFDIEDNLERTQYIEALKRQARALKRVSEFNSVLKSFFMDYAEK